MTITPAPFPTDNHRGLSLHEQDLMSCRGWPEPALILRLRPQEAYASFDFRRVAPYAQDARIVPPFVLSVAERSRRVPSRLAQKPQDTSKRRPWFRGWGPAGS